MDKFFVLGNIRKIKFGIEDKMKFQCRLRFSWQKQGFTLTTSSIDELVLEIHQQAREKRISLNRGQWQFSIISKGDNAKKNFIEFKLNETEQYSFIQLLTTPQ